MEFNFSRRQAMRGLGLLVICSCLGVSGLAAPALANELDDARNSGAIGERPDGLVGPVNSNAPAQILSLVENVNRARMDSYRDLAQREGARIEAVQAVAGERQIEKAVRNGWYVMDPSGSWRQR